jgi:hypothetical protein
VKPLAVRSVYGASPCRSGSRAQPRAAPRAAVTIAAFLLSLAGFASGRGIPPVVLVGTILLPLHVFWFNYQNIWIVMTEGISGRQGYTDAHRIRLATVFFVVTIVALWISVGYWRLIGLV